MVLRCPPLPRFARAALALWLCLALTGGEGHAGSATTRDSLDRLEELLQLRVEQGMLSADTVLPAILVSAEPIYEDSRDWYTTRAIEVIQRAFGREGLRLCEACMAPRAFVDDGRLTYVTGPVSLDEVIRLDSQNRGQARAARTAIWLDEHKGGVSIRIVDLRTGAVLFAQNVDPNLYEHANTARAHTLSAELERRARGESITQAFVDIALYPGQHISVDWTDQWGPTNANLSGIALSIFDPIVGIGPVHYRRVRLLNTLVGGKLLLSLPTAAVRAVGEGGEVLDPLVTLVGVARVPFGGSNYGGVLTISTNGEVGFGVSLMNISLIPVLP